MPIENQKIKKKYLILCEGKDAQRFLICYLENDSLKNDKRFSEDIQVFDYGGVNDLSAYLDTLKKLEHYDEVAQILVLRDAETNAKAAMDSVKASLKKHALPVPEINNLWQKGESIKTAYSLFPTCDKTVANGALEDLCWDIIADERAAEYRSDIQAFMNQINEKYGSIKTHAHKGRLHSYFSVQDKLVSLKVGEAADKDAFDWQNEKLLPLRNLIAEGFED